MVDKVTDNSAKLKFKIGDKLSFNGENIHAATITGVQLSKYEPFRYLVEWTPNNPISNIDWNTDIIEKHLHKINYMNSPLWRKLEGLPPLPEVPVAPQSKNKDNDE